MFSPTIKAFIAAGSVGLIFSIGGCSSSDSSSSSQESMSAMADSCLQKLTTTINLPLPMDSSDTAGILAYATALGGCMQKLNADEGIYCQTAEGSDGVPHQWCGKHTANGTDDIDLSALVRSKVPTA